MARSSVNSLVSRLAVLHTIGMGLGHQALAQHVTDAAPAAAEKCGGVLGLCDDQNRVYLYSCQGDDVVIQRCATKESTFPVKTKKDCVGPERKVTKKDFQDFITDEVWNGNRSGPIGPITPDDLSRGKSPAPAENPKAKKEAIEKRLESIDGMLLQLGKLMSEATKKCLEHEKNVLNSQELPKAEAALNECMQRDAALSKVSAEIERGIAKICEKNGIHVPEADSFLHQVLAKYEPTKVGCTPVKNPVPYYWSMYRVGTLMHRTCGDEGTRDFVTDDVTRLTWSVNSARKMSYADAVNHCESLGEKGAKWRLPSASEVQYAFAGNVVNDGNQYRQASIVDILKAPEGLMWVDNTYSQGSTAAAVLFSNYPPAGVYQNRSSLGTVVCVSP